MVENMTAVQVLQQQLGNAAKAAEKLIDDLKLTTFPKDGDWEDEAVNNYFAQEVWRWEYWEGLVDCNRYWSHLETVARNCDEVKDEHARLAAALEVLNKFAEVVSDHSDGIVSTVEALGHILNITAFYAENWPKYRSIFSLPEGMTLESPEVRENPNAFIDRSKWSDLCDDIERWSEIESAAYGCVEVKAEFQRLETALNVLRDMKNIPFRGSL